MQQIQQAIIQKAFFDEGAFIYFVLFCLHSTAMAVLHLLHCIQHQIVPEQDIQRNVKCIPQDEQLLGLWKGDIGFPF